MYLRRSEGDAGVPRLVPLLRKVVDAADSLDARRPGGSNVTVAVSSFAPPGAAIGVAVGACLIM